MHSVLLHNFPHPKLVTTLDSGRLHMIHGFEQTRQNQQCRRDLGSDFILSLLMHERLCVEFAHLSYLLEIFGLQDTTQLLLHGCVEILLDKNFQPVVVVGDKGIESGIALTRKTAIPHFERLQAALEETGINSKAG
jgi:hypothetical protein